MELQASQIIARIERAGLLKFSGNDKNLVELQGDLTVNEFISQTERRQTEIYGECAKPIRLGILENGSKAGDI